MDAIVPLLTAAVCQQGHLRRRHMCIRFLLTAVSSLSAVAVTLALPASPQLSATISSSTPPPPTALVYFAESQRALLFHAASPTDQQRLPLSTVDLSKPFSLSNPPLRAPLSLAHPEQSHQLVQQAQASFTVPCAGPSTGEFALLSPDHATAVQIANGMMSVIERVSSLQAWPSNGKLRARPSFSTTAATQSAGVQDSRCFMLGGLSNSGAGDQDLLMFDAAKTVTTVSLSSSSARPSPRHSGSLIRFDSNRLLLTGGTSDSSNSPLADAWVFDLATSSWLQIADLSSGPRTLHQAVVMRPAAGNGAQAYIVLLGGSGQGPSSSIEYAAIPPPDSSNRSAWVWKSSQPAIPLAPFTISPPLLSIQDQLLAFGSDAALAAALKVKETSPGTLAFESLESYTPLSASSPSILEQNGGPVSATMIIIVAGVCVGIIGLVFVFGIVWYRRHHPHDDDLSGMFRAHHDDTPLGVSFEPLALPRQATAAPGRRPRSRTNSLPAQPVPTAWAMPPRRRTISTGRKVQFQLPAGSQGRPASEPELHLPESPSLSGSGSSPDSLFASPASAPLLVPHDTPLAGAAEGSDVPVGGSPCPQVRRGSLKYPAAAAVADSIPGAVDATTPLLGRKCKRSVSWHASTGVLDNATPSRRPVLHSADVHESPLEDPLLFPRRTSSPAIEQPAKSTSQT